MMSIDLIAAFDVVSHDLLLQKMVIYGMDSNVIKWARSYLSQRSQLVSIGNKLSGFKPIHEGVPQGSCLGPISYLLFTNDLPEVGHATFNHKEKVIDNEYLFGNYCQKCGITVKYADWISLSR